ncbi:MAG TPA: hypothetical protein VMR52_02550 [Dehalococcoidia bacterium]|nr:hypothetical protein [Dehalococcoidia bacterium]
MTLLHIGGASAGTVLVSVIAIFFLLFAMSFAVGSVPEGHRRFSKGWTRAWLRASLPRSVLAAGFSALLFVGSALSGGGQSDADIAATCEAPLAPNTGREITESRLAVAVDGMRAIADAARSGEMAEAQTLFLTNDSHNVAHDIDAPLRLRNSALARDLCEAVLRFEREIAADAVDGPALAEEAESIAGYLETARDVYDFATPEPAAGGGLCTSPVGAVTDEPLTASRIEAAATLMRQAGELAEGGDTQAAAQAFGGDTHNITHDIDGPLRLADQELAIELCIVIVALETEFGSTQDNEIIATNASAGANLLEEAGRALGITG